MKARVRSTAIIGLLLAFVLAGCSLFFEQVRAAEVCADVAATSGEEHVVGGAFATTIEAFHPA